MSHDTGAIIIEMRKTKDIDDNSRCLEFRTMKKIVTGLICILSCTSIALLIAGLLVGSVYGKNDSTSESLLISFGAIFGCMILGGIICGIVAFCGK